MKTITLLLFTLLLNACGTSNTATAKSELVNSQTKMAQDPIKIEYSALSRGSFSKIILDNKTVNIQNSRNEIPTVKVCSDDEWNKIMTMVSNLNLKNLSSLEAPSKAHQYDGAKLGSFTITKDGETYAAPTFDAGNPHKDIAPIVEMLLTFSQKKQ